ncbi:antibiotic biosynthesis monooxygenase [Mesobacillus maritimus]|uniref:putative quinol monooxygenase n=1 Tax=Mesobacillus maritimus TaxID=1643336 RepID=UPI00203A76A5|nr:putative quinol monooxygenase [Mesobacillus maritimus]MCM3587760.1 antibiotic biosynthesis monooxygenase [Mesobacillus maritimus]
MIILHADIKVKSEYRETFLEEARLVTKLSQAESGNISYHFYEDPENANSFVFVEKWKDEHAIQQHEETSHFKKFVQTIETLLSEPIHAELFEASPKNK